jgi:tRNA threonylcarbamoyladenosine biosynthesis protein TsaB
MNVLAFDTCLGALSVAVRWRSAAGEWLWRDAYEVRSSGHAERLFPTIVEVMEGAGLSLSAIDRFAVTAGPGTFTGVRVGVAAARAFALATGKPLVGVTSLAAMAHRADLLLGPERAGRPLAVAVDARRAMVYFQQFVGDVSAGGAARLVTPDEAAGMIADTPAVAIGSGAEAVAAAAGMGVEVRLPDLQPHARSVAALALVLDPTVPLTPIYLRPPDVRPQTGAAVPRMPP